MGLVEFQGQWQRPDAVKQEIQKDPRYQELVREYLARRVKTTSPKPDANFIVESRACWFTTSASFRRSTRRSITSRRPRLQAAIERGPVRIS